MSRLRRLTREGHRQLIEDMAVVLIGEIEIGNDQGCIMSLLARGFHPRDISDCLDAARAMVRQALVDEAGLWERLMR
jgi:predicted nucleic acid-binding protein